MIQKGRFKRPFSYPDSAAFMHDTRLLI